MGADSTEGFGRDVQRLVAYFYSDDSIIASTRANRLHWSFFTLLEIFDGVCLCYNAAKTMIMACQ